MYLTISAKKIHEAKLTNMKGKKFYTPIMETSTCLQVRAGAIESVRI